MNIKKISIVFASIVAITVSVTAQTNWSVDPRHSKIKFTTTHSMITEVDGYFKIYEGQITGAKEDFTGASILFSADASSINTEDEQRDGHLKSPDFFDVEKYPKITFKSTSFKKLNGKNYKLVGDLY
jgi:polyisoprenoid-binding protein YceI